MGGFQVKVMDSVHEDQATAANTAIIYKWTGPGGLEVTTGIQGDEAHDSVAVGDDLLLPFAPSALSPGLK